MPSSKQQIVRERPFGGADQGVRDHLIEEGKWFRSFGMRHFESRVTQVARKKELYEVLTNHAYPLSLVHAVPAGYENFSTVVGLTDAGVFRLSGTAASRVEGKEPGDDVLKTDGRIRRFGHTLYNNRLFFVNPLNAVRYTDGAQVRTFGSEAPAGSYVEIFFDHVVVGRPIVGGIESVSRVTWSNLYDWTKWRPASENEADSFDCVDYSAVGSEGWTGVTGVRRLGGLLFTYTPSAIYVSRYVGLPRVMITDVLPQNDFGNGFPYALTGTASFHFFIDAKHESFYRFDGASVSEIGRPIRNVFFPDLTTNESWRYRTYAYVDPRFKEVHWVYVSTASNAGAFDREVVYNYRENLWWHGPVEDTWSFCPGARRARTISELVNTFDSASGGIEEQADAGDILGRVYGSSNGRLLREEVTSDSTSTLLEQPVPELELGDQAYGDIENHKEVESMVIHSKYVDAVGVEVLSAVRNHFDDSVSFSLLPQVWTPALPEQRLSFPRISGRIHRFKFRPKVNPSNTVTTVTRTKPTTSVALRTQIDPLIIEINTCGTYEGNPTTGGTYGEHQHVILATPTPPGGTPSYVYVLASFPSTQSPWDFLTTEQKRIHTQFALEKMQAYITAQGLPRTVVRVERLTFCYNPTSNTGYPFTVDPYAYEDGTTPETVFNTEYWQLNVVYVWT